MRQLVYTIFITNNHDSFQLWWKKNLAKHQKVSKYYGRDCTYTKALFPTFLFLILYKVKPNYIIYIISWSHTPNLSSMHQFNYYQKWTKVKIYQTLNLDCVTQSKWLPTQAVNIGSQDVSRTSPKDPIWPSRGRPDLTSRGRPDMTSWGRPNLTSKGYP